MKDTYTVKYRQPSQWLWRTLKGVKGDGVEGIFRFFHLEDDTLVYISSHAEVVFSKERQAIITHRMSKEAGQPIQRA
jgi:hypothetical protein